MQIQACFTLVVAQFASLLDKSRSRSESQNAATNYATPSQALAACDPTAWSSRRKWIYTILVGLTMFNGSFASTAPNGAGIRIVHQYGLSNEELVFVAASFVGGCVAGPLFWAPLSEIYGRRIVTLTSTLLYALSNIGCALAPNKATLFSCRMLAGAFASSAFSNAAAVITDLFPPADRAKPMIVASLAPLLGPCFGPLFGAVISRSLGWPFVFWLLGAIGLILEAALFCLPETYLPVISARYGPKESIASTHPYWKQKVRTFLIINLGRPLFSGSIDSDFRTNRERTLDVAHAGFNRMLAASITFLPMGLGGAIAAALLPLCERYYVFKCRSAGGPVPEARLLPTFFVAPLVATGLL
uniref:Related to TPO3-Polyamine transport protein n=1 Tax=Melanopsichium pennsylvanicum 4 TaxID=1398559 RepID=A0A077R9P6_9BASI|nr:related to TPO3-Polyamine transport protein [Melanopsichium pennsylvanicum 4]